MSVHKRCWAALALWLFALPALAEDWTTVTAGGSTIEVPTYFLTGRVHTESFGAEYEPDPTISFHQYRIQTRDRPYVFLTRAVGREASEINYFVDEVGRGVVSGQAHPHRGFYASCRREASNLVCFELFYDQHGRDFGPMIERISRSFMGGEN